MFRLGVISKDRIPEAVVPPGPAVALTLLDEFKTPMSDADEARLAVIYEMIVEGALFSPMRTFSNRFRSLDRAIADAIEASFRPEQPILVHDMAASNAITSLELFEYLTQRVGNRVSLRATDYFDALYVVTIPNTRWKVILDAVGEPLQFIRGRLILGRREPRRFVINWLLQIILTPRLSRQARRWPPTHRIGLFHPRCVALAGAARGFTLARENAVNPETTSCDVLRIMNLSLRFPLDQSRPWFGPAFRTVMDGGLLVVGDEALKESPLAATIFQHCRDRFLAIRDFAGGYVHRQAVLDLNLDEL
jgi:hypothetical protein